MKKSRESCKNSSSDSIRRVPSEECATDTSEDEKVQQPVLTFDALRTIGRIVREIKNRIELAPEPKK